MDINGISELKTVINSDPTSAANKGDDSFLNLLKVSIEKVNDMQSEADNAIMEFASKKGTSIHETMITMGKADISFRLMMQVRNKMIEAYQEISRMAV